MNFPPSVTPNPLPLDDPARLWALRRLMLLDSPPEANFDRLTRLAAKILDAPVCLISLVDDQRQFFKAAHGLGGPAGEARETPLTHSFCQHVVTSDASLVVNDAPLHPQVCDNLAIRDLGVMAYLGIPIHSPDGFVLGSFCVIDVEPRQWTDRDMALLTELTKSVETEITLRSSINERHIVLAQQQAVLDGTALSVIAMTPEGIISLFNAGAERLLGYSAEEVVGRQTPVAIHLASEVAARASELSAELGRTIEPGFEVFVAVARQNLADEHEWTYVRKDGSHVAVLLTVTALRDSLGEITGFLGVSKDITDYRAAEAEAKTSRERLSSIFNSASYGIVLQNTHAEILECNVAAERILGLTRAQLLGRTSLDPRWRSVHEDGSDFPEATHPSQVALGTCQPVRDITMGVYRPDGSLVWVLINAEPVFDSEGVVQSVVLSFADITLRKITQAKLEEAVDRFHKLGQQIPGIIYQFRLRPDGSSCFPYASDGIREIYQVTPEEVLHDASKAFAILHPDDLPAVRESIQVSARDLTPWKEEYRMRYADGTVRWLAGNSMPEREPDGSVLWHGFITDITERKGVEALLHLESQRAQLAADIAEIGIWDWDITTNAVVWDEQLHRIYGTSLQANAIVPFQMWADAVLPEDLPAQLVTLDETVKSGGRSEREFRIKRTSDGSVRHVQSIEKAVLDANGRTVRVVGVNRDVTAVKEAEAAIRDSESRFRTLSQNAPVGIYETDSAGACTYVNARWCEITGIPQELAMGQGWLSALHPEDRDSIFAAWLGLTQGAAEFSIEYRFLRKGGFTIWVAGHAVPQYDSAGELSGYLGTIIDISERKRAEDSQVRLAAIVNSTDEAVIGKNLDGTITSWNPGATKVFGYAAQEAIGHSMRMLIPPERADEESKILERIGNDETVETFETVRIRKDGAKIDISATICPIKDLNGKRIGISQIVRDISAQKQLELRLAQARDQALEASKLKSEFLANMSHEIRTPMNGVIGMSSLLADTALSPEQQEMTGVIRNSAESLLVIINDILDFSKIEAGKLQIEHVDFDPARVIEETLALLAPRASEKSIELLCDFQTDLPAALLGDSIRIRQVLTNLVSNAIKFTETGEVAVSVHCKTGHAGWHIVRVEVRDTGIGIPADEQAKLFQAFTQADGSITRRYGGTGLGLAISRQLVELMAGTIGFSSEPNRGSTFWFELNLEHGGAAAESHILASLPAGLELLVVDDNPTNQRILRMQLSRMGVLNLEVAHSAAEALAALQTRRARGRSFDAILLDWAMPDKDGIELAKEIRDDPANVRTPILMLSSTGKALDNTTAGSLRFAAILTKPVRQEQLHRALLNLDAGIPAAASSAGAGTQGAAGTGRTEAGAPAGVSGYRLLVAEDNPANQMLIRMLLERAGHQCQIAPDGQAALELLAESHFDAILMDCQMPRMDGYTATRHIRSGLVAGANVSIPIIALTAYAMPGDKQKSFEAGMNGHLTKPIRPALLAEELERCGLRALGKIAPALPPPPVEAGPVLDLKHLEMLRSLPGDRCPNLLMDLRELFFVEAEQALLQLRVLEEGKAQEEFAMLAHRLGGSSATLGALSMRAAALMAEKAARNADWTAVGVALTNLDRDWISVRDALQRLD